MRIAYFMTGLGLTGGPLVHYRFMDGLCSLGHEVFVITADGSLRWDPTVSADLSCRTTGEPSPTELRGPVGRAVDTIGRAIHSALHKGLRVTATHALERIAQLARRDHAPEPYSTKDQFSRTTAALIQNYRTLGMEPDVYVATHVLTAPATFLLGRHGRIVMFSLHFEELMYSDACDRTIVAMINHLPFNHAVNSSWLYNMFKYNYGITAAVILPGIDTRVFRCKERPSGGENSKPNLIITYCDTQRPFKGLAEQIAILTEVCRTRPQTEVSIFGHDPQVSSFPYRYLGWLDHGELSAAYRKADVLFSSSWYESFPLPPIEAMACGCVPVACRYGTEDYLVPDVNGLTISPFETHETAAELIRLLDDPDRIRRMSVEGPLTANRFAWGTNVDRWVSFLSATPVLPSLSLERIQSGAIQELSRVNR